MNKHKKYIKDAYNGKLGLKMCNDWKQAIEKQYPEFKESKLEIGKWYFFKKSNALGYFKGYEKESYGIHADKSWVSCQQWFYENESYKVRPATDKEVEQALIKELKRLGFKKGVITECVSVGGNKSTLKSNMRLSRSNGDYRILVDSDDCAGWTCIFKNGVFAKIVETITKEEAEKLLDKTIV